MRPGATPPPDASAERTRFAEAHRGLPAVPPRPESIVIRGGTWGRRRSDGLPVPRDRVPALDLGSPGGPVTA